MVSVSSRSHPCSPRRPKIQQHGKYALTVHRLTSLPLTKGTGVRGGGVKNTSKFTLCGTGVTIGSSDGPRSPLGRLDIFHCTSSLNYEATGGDSERSEMPQKQREWVGSHGQSRQTGSLQLNKHYFQKYMLQRECAQMGGRTPPTLHLCKWATVPVTRGYRGQSSKSERKKLFKKPTGWWQRR